MGFLTARSRVDVTGDAKLSLAVHRAYTIILPIPTISNSGLSYSVSGCQCGDPFRPAAWVQQFQIGLTGAPLKLKHKLVADFPLRMPK